MSKPNLKNKWIWILIFLYIGFIWSNSLQPGTDSGSLSKNITQMILDVLSYINVSFDFDAFHHFIRKLAHFSEYAILGNLVMLALHSKPLLKTIQLNYVLFLILPASIDESIQHFIPGRYGAITDVLIDMSGFLFGSLLVYVIVKLINSKQANHFL